MCLSFIPPRRARTKKINLHQCKSPVSTSPKKKKLRIQHKRKVKTQLSLENCFGISLESFSDPSSGTIEATGDPLIDKPDNCIRLAFKNVNSIGIQEGLDVMPETATIGALQLDVAGLTETNVPWSQANKDKMRSQLTRHLGESRVVCASNTAQENATGYQPGGAILTVVGKQTVRMIKTGTDPWGRFAWSELRGERDEGILVISAYRVSQTKGTTSCPNTAYSQQINQMIIEGDMDLDPRTRILHDLGNLITQKRAEGFRPILMMDANDDWLQTSSKAFKAFIEDMRLVDPYYEKIKTSGLTGTTYARGSRRIDFIFVDSTILPAIKRIGTLGLHEGIISDHIMLYMDCDERLLFGGIIN